MTESHERLSALIDDWHGDEADRAELDRLLGDVNERARWQRYQLIGEAMRHELPQRIQVDFSASVMARIEQEGLQPEGATARPRTAPARSTVSGWWASLMRPVAGLSVAVAVAFVAVTSLTETPLPAGGSGQVVASADSTPSDPRIEQLTNLPVLAPSVKVSAGSRTPSNRAVDRLQVRRDQAAIQRKLNGYLVDHNQYAGSLQGIIPQVRVVATGGRN